MNQQEKQIIKNIVAVFPMLDESNKKYLLGFGSETGKCKLKRQSRQAAALQGEVYHQIGQDSAEADKSERRD